MVRVAFVPINIFQIFRFRLRIGVRQTFGPIGRFTGTRLLRQFSLFPFARTTPLLRKSPRQGEDQKEKSKYAYSRKDHNK